MSNGQAFQDDNHVPVSSLYDPVGHQVVNWQAGTVSTDASTNQKYAAASTLTSAAQGYVSAYGSNPAALTANTDATFKWGTAGTTQVNHVMIQNNSAASINWDLDAASTAGSPVLASGQTLFLDVQSTAVHVQSTGTPNLNGSSASNIVIRGWL